MNERYRKRLTQEQIGLLIPIFDRIEKEIDGLILRMRMRMRIMMGKAGIRVSDRQ